MASDAEPIYGALPDNWRMVSVAQLVEDGDADVQTGPFGTMLHASAYQPEGTPVVAVKNIGDNRLIADDIPRVSAATLRDLSRYQLREGDILFGRKGAVERRAYVRADEHGWLQGSDCIRLRLRGAVVNSRFLSLVLGCQAYRSWITQHAHGATMPSLNQEILKRIPVPLPPPDEQRAIAHILGTLDDKIELNRRMNETLEAMARALFKSWFVDFDPVRAKAEGRDLTLPKHLADLFPDSLEDSEIGEIPSGWRVSPVYDLATYINGAAYRAFEPNEERRGLPIIKIAELKAGVTAQTRFSAVEMPDKYRIDNGDMLFSWSGNPDTSIDIFVWNQGPAWLNQHIFRVVPNSEDERAFVLMTLRNFLPVFAEIARNKQTTGLGHVTVEDLKRLFAVRPPKSVLLVWNTIVEPLLARSFGLEGENNTLAALRDTLLPKLISGEIRIKDAERIAGVA